MSLSSRVVTRERTWYELFMRSEDCDACVTCGKSLFGRLSVSTGLRRRRMYRRFSGASVSVPPAVEHFDLAKESLLAGKDVFVEPLARRGRMVFMKSGSKSI